MAGVRRPAATAARQRIRAGVRPPATRWRGDVALAGHTGLPTGPTSFRSFSVCQPTLRRASQGPDSSPIACPASPPKVLVTDMAKPAVTW